MTFSLKLFGAVSLKGEQGPLSGRAVQRHRLAVLAMLAVSRPGSLTRDKLMACLWPERDAEHARGLLNQAVHVLRQSLGAEAILSAGEELQLNPALVSCDVVRFREAVATGQLKPAVALYTGPLLDGFFLSEAPEFERWVEQERDRLAAAYAGVLESLAEQAGTGKNWRGAVEWWNLRAKHDPYDSRVAVRLMLALDASGNRAGALSHALSHQRLLQQELGIEPSPEVEALAARLRASPVASPAWHPLEPAAARPDPVVPVTPSPSEAEATAALHRSRPPMAFRYAAGAILVAAALASLRFWSGGSGQRSSAETLPPAVVDEIAQAVAREVARRERGDTMARLPQHRTRSIPAYELYLRGSDPALLRSDSAARLGLTYFQRAIALDSTYAAAWAGLARLSLRVGYDLRTRRQYHDQGERAALRALALDDSLAEAHASLGLVRIVRWDLSGAEFHLRRALELEPNSARYREWMVRFLVAAHRAPEALAEGRRALELDPLSPTANAEMARALLALGRSDEALSHLDRIAGLDPPLARAPMLRAQCYVQQHRWREALAWLQPLTERRMPYTLGLYGYALARSGQAEPARQVLDTLEAAASRPGRLAGRPALEFALVYAGLGDVPRMVAWLERGLADGTMQPFDETFPTMVAILDSLRQHPGVAGLRRRLGIQDR